MPECGFRRPRGYQIGNRGEPNGKDRESDYRDSAESPTIVSGLWLHVGHRLSPPNRQAYAPSVETA